MSLLLVHKLKFAVKRIIFSANHSVALLYVYVLALLGYLDLGFLLKACAKSMAYGFKSKALILAIRFEKESIKFPSLRCQGLFLLAKAYSVNSMKIEASSTLSQGLFEFPEDKNFLLEARSLYRQLGSISDFINLSIKISETYPNDANCQICCLEALSLCDKEHSHDIASFVSRFPSEPRILSAVCKYYRIRGCYKDAVYYSALLMKLEPHSPEFLALHIKDQLSLGSYLPDDVIITAKTSLVYSSRSQKLSRDCEMISCLISQEQYSKHLVDLWLSSFNLLSSNSATSSVSAIQGKIVAFEDWVPFQYWSQGTPPPDIMKLTSRWNKLFGSMGIRPIKIFSRQSAYKYLHKYCPGLVPAFSTAFHYAVEADVFRAGFALCNNCIWLDSDLYPLNTTGTVITRLLSSSRTSFMFRQHKPWITNAFFATPSHSDFFTMLVQQMSGYTFKNKPQNIAEILNSFGPARYNNILNRLIVAKMDTCANSYLMSKQLNRGGELASELKLSFCNDFNAMQMGPPFDLDYKRTKASWQVAFGA